MDMNEDDDEKFDKFVKKYDLGEYEQKYVKGFGGGEFIFTISLSDEKINEIYRMAEIYFSSQKYNL